MAVSHPALEPPYPLHPSVRDRLDPVYVEFYNKHLINQQQVHLQPIEASRKSGILIPGSGPLIPVGKTADLKIRRTETPGPEVKIRVFTPEGTRPSQGWPLVAYFHGGGWVLGNIDTENVVCTNLCARASCIVVTVDYRAAPEHPYPAAVHDCWEVLLWLHTTGVSVLNFDPQRCAIGGSSAGGNLTAVMCHRILVSKVVPPFVVQILNVPVMDNTATIETNNSWKENQHVCALPSAKMMWYRNHYLPDPETWKEPEASPLLYSGGWDRQPKALVVVGELDVLRDEGVAYAEKLSGAGVEVVLKVLKGMPHPFLAMDGVLQQGRDTITDMVEALKSAFETHQTEE